VAVPPAVRILIGIPLLAVLPLASVVGLVALSPLLILSLFLPQRERRGNARTIQRVEGDEGVTFNRIADVSKLFGCDTRNVQYRWSIFEAALDEMSRSGRRAALDFGAGSLRDSWELARAGFAVISVDIDERQLRRSLAKYDWSDVARRPELFVGPPSELASSEVFDLITAFDVFEHLTELDPVVDELRHRLAPGGKLLVSVPNGRTLRERVGRLMHWMRGRLGVGSSRAGVPHVNFKSPRGWARYFESRGLRVERHEMTIGSLVNDWHFIHSFPLGASGLARRFPNLERAFCPQWLMRRLDLVDQNLKWLLEGLWAWNLFVLARADLSSVHRGD
jgi:SAM-dependent methyltransferase